MRYFNAMEAAKELDISDKTVRRWCKKGKITSKRTEFNEIAIPEDEIERIRAELEEARAQLRQTGQPIRDRHAALSPVSMLSNMSSREDIQDIEARLSSMAQSLANLNATVASQTRRIDELAKRVVELEANKAPVENVPVPPIPQSSSHPSTPKPQPQNRIVEPSDMLSVRDFAAKIGMEYTVLDGYIRRGVRGGKMDVTEVPTSRKGYNNKYFTSSQQQAAIELLKRHGKI